MRVCRGKFITLLAICYNFSASFAISGWTPLHEAVNHGHTKVASVLIKAGANVNAKGYEDVTPLHDAVLVGKVKLVKLLVGHGADTKAKNSKLETPADIAATVVSKYMKSE